MYFYINLPIKMICELIQKSMSKLKLAVAHD